MFSLMKLKQLVKSIGNPRIYPSGLIDFCVKGITCNSKNIQDNFIFIAIKGNREDGHKFIPEAIDRGAKAIIVQSSKFKVQSSKKIQFIKVKDTRQAQALLAAEFYGNPSGKIKVVGVTGTNGKTTITYLLEALIKECGSHPAVIGTVNYRFKDRLFPSKNTTPGPIEIQSMLAQMLKVGVDYAVMEVSSHALDQARTKGINFYSAIFTNLTQDHLDYHKTLENYFQSKARLFRNMSRESFVIINNDSAHGRRLKRLTPAKIITYGIDQPADITARDIKYDIRYTEFVLDTAKGKIGLKTRLIGRHNVYNVLAAIAWALNEGMRLAVIKSALEKFSFVPGRLERIDSGGSFCVFVDYAHTPDALENAVRALKQLSQNRVIVVFGCGGERDKTKRPKMGRCVTELADYCIITNDNPRSEDPQRIINDIEKGINKDNYSVVFERFDAISQALNMAKSGDSVLIAGKGHENYQILRDRVLSFDDREAARRCLELMNY